MEELIIKQPKFNHHPLNTYLNDELLEYLKKFYKELIGIWALFAFFIVLNSAIDFNDTSKESVNIYQTTEVKIRDIYRNGKVLANGKAPIFYHLALPTGKNIRIHIENTPTTTEIKSGKGSRLSLTESDSKLKVGSIITLYEISVIQAGNKTTSVYTTTLLAAQAQQARLANTRKNALWKIALNTLEYLLTDALIVTGAGILMRYVRKNDDNSDNTTTIVANTQSSYVQLPKL